MTQLSSNTRKVIRELAGLQTLADALDQIDNLDQAIESRRNEIQALDGKVQEARQLADEQVNEIRQNAEQTVSGINGEVEQAKAVLAGLQEEIEKASGKRDAILADVESAETRAKEAQAALANIAAKIG